MISYKPLWHTLLDRDMRKMDLVNELGMSRSTIAKMGKDEPVALSIIDKICNHLDCKIEDVVEITKDPGD